MASVVVEHTGSPEPLSTQDIDATPVRGVASFSELLEASLSHSPDVTNTPEDNRPRLVQQTQQTAKLHINVAEGNSDVLANTTNQMEAASQLVDTPSPRPFLKKGSRNKLTVIPRKGKAAAVHVPAVQAKVDSGRTAGKGADVPRSPDVSSATARATANANQQQPNVYTPPRPEVPLEVSPSSVSRSVSHSTDTYRYQDMAYAADAYAAPAEVDSGYHDEDGYRQPPPASRQKLQHHQPQQHTSYAAMHLAGSPQDYGFGDEEVVSDNEPVKSKTPELDEFERIEAACARDAGGEHAQPPSQSNDLWDELAASLGAPQPSGEPRGEPQQHAWASKTDTPNGTRFSTDNPLWGEGDEQHQHQHQHSLRKTARAPAPASADDEDMWEEDVDGASPAAVRVQEAPPSELVRSLFYAEPTPAASASRRATASTRRRTMRRSADATQPPQQQQQQQQQQHNTAAVAAEMAELRARAEEAERVAKEERRRSLALRTELERERAKHAKALEVEAERTASALAAAADAKTTADKLARRERRLLDQQSQWADAQLTTKKGREELERATAELEEVKSAARAQDRRHKMETERLRSRNGDLSSRVNELEDEVRRLGVAKLAAEERAAAAADAATRRERRSVAEVPTSSAPMTMSMSTTSSSGAIAAKAAASPASPLRASEPAAPSGKRAPRVVRFPNGTVKETRADGVVVVGFTNGDLKVQRTDGTVEYYYAEVGTWHASNSSGNGAPELYFFPGGQAEAHFVGGSKEILFPDGACRLVDANGEEEDVPPAEAPVRLRALAALRGGPPSRPHGPASEISA